MGLFSTNASKLQAVLNASDRLIEGLSKFSHNPTLSSETPFSAGFIHQRIQFKGDGLQYSGVNHRGQQGGTVLPKVLTGGQQC